MQDFSCKKCFEDCDETVAIFIALYDEDLEVMNNDDDKEEESIKVKLLEEDGDH